MEPKVLIVWMVLVTAILAFATLGNSQRNKVAELSVKEVVTAVRKGEIAGGSMVSDYRGGEGWYKIQGEFRQAPVVEGEGPSKGGVMRFVAEGRLTQEDFVIIRDAFKEKRASNWASELFGSLLPILFIVGLLYFIFTRQLRSAGRGAMNFGKSKAKMLTRDREKITFKDVAGCDEAKEEVKEIVEFLREPKKFQRIGGRIPKGVLMVGPPGTGKTLLAKAVAGEADVPFFTISGSDFVEMFVGVGAARVRDMFEQGRKNAPCLIFIDEIDAVGRQRGAGLGGGNDEREQTLNSLLVEMDGFDGHEGVIIIAATNRPDVLDSALLRPGRFDREVVIDLPDLNGRYEILKVHAKKIKLSSKVDLSITARNTPGFSGADLANLLNEAALIAARYGKNEVETSDMDEAREKIAYGRERRRLMDDEDKKIVAYHEAGHAIVQAVIDDGTLPVHKVTIIPRGQSLGSTMMSPSKDILNQSKRRLINQICCSMGGRVAEEIVIGDITTGASGDIKMATKIARKMVCDWGMSPMGPVAFGENQDHIFLGKEIARDQNYSEKTAQLIDVEIRQLIEGQYQRARDILLDKRSALDLLAESLLKHETLDGVHVKEILEHGEIRSPIYVRPPTPNSSDDEEDGKPKKAAGKEDKDEVGPEAAAPAGAPA
ncbi:MAG: ATP-dependent zinc metalloprotease FtsH [Opitutales bacterium]|nr:ATP-dependent zinc metalloprotease FtsH [Opitutales bacterium]